MPRYELLETRHGERNLTGHNGQNKKAQAGLKYCQCLPISREREEGLLAMSRTNGLRAKSGSPGATP